MSEEFDPEELRSFVDQVLKDGPVAVKNDSRPDFERPSGIPLGLFEGRLLEKLARLLPEHLDQADAQMVLSELRREMTDGIAIGDLRTMHTTVRNCRKCPNVYQHGGILPLWNNADPDCVFVIDNMQIPIDAKDLLRDALKEAGFTSRRCCLTAVTRCPLNRNGPPDQEEISNCSKYLFPELQVMSPKLIVALGTIPAQTLLGGAAVKITEERGRIVWVGPWPILLTLSPGYALRGKGADDLKRDIEKAHLFCYGKTP